MKKTFAPLIVLFALLASSFSLSGSFSMQVKADSDAAFILQLENPAKKKLQLSIRHSNLGVLVDTTIFSTAFRCRYNMTEVEDGNYHITISDGREQLSKAIQLKTTTTVRRDLVVTE